MAAELLAPDELPDLIESDDYKALPFDQRQKVLTGALGEAHQWQAQNGGWTADSWKQFGELASVARRRVTESETFGEKAKSVAGTIGGVVKDSAVAGSLMTLGTMNTVTASVFPVGRNFAANMGRAKQAGMESLRQSAGPETNWLEGDLKGLKKDIDEGNIPFGDQAKLDEWLKGHDETLARDATAYQIKVGKRTPEEAAQWSRDNGLLGNPQNAGLLASYMQTRDPAALDALRDNLLTTKGRAEANAAQVKMNKASIGGKALDALGVGSEMLAEAGDPLEVAGTVLPVLKGANLVRKGVSAGRKIGAAAAATAGEVASELGSQFIDNPNATWEQRAQVAKETLYGTLGLAGIGAAAGKVLQSRQTPVSEQSPAAAISSPPPIPGAPSPAAQPTTNNQAPGTLSSIAQRGGTADVPSAMPDLQEHTGDLTAADVADLEAAAAPPPLFPSSSPPSPASVTPEASPVPIPEAPASAPVAPVADAGSTPAAGTTPSPETALTRATTDRMASDTGDAQNNEPSPGGLSEAEVARMALFDQVRADAASKIRDGEVTRTAYGENWENMKSSAPLFDHFTLPAGWKMKEDWFGTNGGSWYATIEDAGGREYKISVRDHEPTRKDMGIPDYFREVSKEWHPEEVNAALSGLEQRLQRRADYQSRLRSDAGFREAEAHKQARRELDRFEQLIQENEKKADDLDARGKTEKAANARIQAQQMREGSTYKSLIATLNKANAEPLAESGAASHIITGDRTNGSFGIKPKPEGAAAPTRAEGVRMANRASEATSDSEEISPQTPPSVNPESTGAADRTSLFRNLDPSGTTAGYLNTDIINEAVDLIARGFRDFASWSKAMLTRFGQRIGDYLQGVWQAAMKTSQRGSIGGDPLRRNEGTTSRSDGAGDQEPGTAETRSRFARPEADERLYQVRADADVKAAALAWVDSVSLADAVAQLESGTLPEGMTDDVGQRAAAEILMRAGEIMRSGTEVQRLQARALSHRMGKVWQGWMSQEAGRNLRQRAVANAELQPFAPILAAENVLIDRADAVVTKRFEGGAAGGVRKVLDLADKVNGMLPNLLNNLRLKMFPGMTWADIFMDLPSTQKERQRAIYQRLQLDERLRGLSADERLALTNELDKAWQRERRKVFNRELEKAGVLGEKDTSDRAKVQKAMPRLLRMINLGMMNSEMFREAIAPEYGLRMLSGDEALKLRTLAEEAWKLPEGVLRNRKLGGLLAGIQKATGASTAELLNHYWVASVLSGLRTMFDTFMSSLNGFGTNLIQAGQLIATGKGKAAVSAHMQWWRGLSDGTREALQILTKGDYSYLKRFNEDMRRALDGESTFRPVPLGESLWKNGSWWQKYGMAPVMIWTGRLMAAADHINNTATSQGAMAAARALHPELYNGASAWTPQERTAARTQAMREVTGGSEPTTREDAATISARTREILNGNISPETRAEGNFIGDQAAYQNDPIGILGGVYQMMNAGLGSGERALQSVADRIGADGRAGAFAKAALTWASGAVRAVAGAKFIRFGANFGNDMMGYMPGTYLLSRAGQSLDLIERTRSQNALLLGKNVFGLVASSTVAAMFAEKDDDEDGWHIEGSWGGMTPEQKAQRRTAGMEPLSFWKRDGGKVQRLSYRSWPTAGIFVSVGSMADERRFDPVKFKHRGVAGHLLHAVTAGALQVKDVNAVRGLAELFGASAMSADPEADFMERLLKLPLNYLGGAVPTVVKDLDAIRDLRMYQPDGVLEELARNVPGALQQVSGGRPRLNKLGEPIELDRKPWSRAYTNMESGAAHRVLGSLLSRGLDLPSASSDRMVFHQGQRVPIKSLGAEVEYKYQRRVGEGYKQWLASDEGRALLTMPVEQAAKVIDRKATTIKMMAALAATAK